MSKRTYIEFKPWINVQYSAVRRRGREDEAGKSVEGAQYCEVEAAQ